MKRFLILLALAIFATTAPAADNPGAGFSRDSHHPHIDATGARKGVSVNGSSQYLDVSDPAGGELDFTDESMSNCIWVYMLSTPTGSEMATHKFVVNVGGYSIYYSTSSKYFVFQISEAGGPSFPSVSHTAFTDHPIGEWHFIVGVHEQGVGLRLSLDGGAFDTFAHTAGIDATATAYAVGAITTPSNYINARLSGSGVWREALSLEKVKRLYNNGRGRRWADLDAGLRTNCEAYYDLDELDGTRADSGPNGLDLTAYNSPVNADGPGKRYVADFNGTDMSLTNRSFTHGSPNHVAFSLWLNPHTLSTGAYYFYYGPDAIGGGNLQVYGGTTGVNVNWGAAQLITASVDEWLHITVFVDDTFNTYVYGNGALIGTTGLGAAPSGADNISFGALDDEPVRLWADCSFGPSSMFEMGSLPSAGDRLAMAAALYNNGSPLSLADAKAKGDADLNLDKLIAWWDMDEHSGTRADKLNSSNDLGDNNDTITAISPAPHRHNPQSEYLLHFDGADAATAYADTGRADNATPTLTFGSNAQLDTAIKKFGTAALLFDGIDDYATLPNSTSTYYADGDLTIDLWVYVTTLAADFVMASQYDDASNWWWLYFDSTNGLRFQVKDGGTNTVIMSQNATTGWSTSTWMHVRVCRKGDSWGGWVDGVSVATLTDESEVPSLSGALELGAYNSGASSPLPGSIDAYRSIKGTALTTPGAGFTAPTTSPER